MAKKDIKPRVRVPRSLKKGQVFEVKTLVSHPMESGRRKNKETGKLIPREIINRLQVTYNGETVLDATWHPAVSANPYTAFFVRAKDSGPMVFTWTDDKGETYKKTVQVKVSG